jgi:hypothetical protein
MDENDLLDEFDAMEEFDIQNQFDLNAPKGWRFVEGGAYSAAEWEER